MMTGDELEGGGRLGEPALPSGFLSALNSQRSTSKPPINADKRLGFYFPLGDPGGKSWPSRKSLAWLTGWL